MKVLTVVAVVLLAGCSNTSNKPHWSDDGVLSMAEYSRMSFFDKAYNEGIYHSCSNQQANAKLLGLPVLKCADISNVTVNK